MRRTRLVVNVGNLIELVGASAVVDAVDRLAGLPWALLLAGVLLVIAAELIYDTHTWQIPLPHRPRPRAWLLDKRQRFGIWRMRRRAQWARWRAEKANP